MNILSGIYKLINMDIKSENELKDLTVLLRILCILDIVGNLLLGIIINISYGVVVFHIAFFTLLYAITLACSYRNGSRSVTWMYSLILMISTLCYCLYISPGLGFRFGAVPLIPLLFYRVDQKKPLQIFSVVSVFVVNLALGIHGLYIGESISLSILLKAEVIILETVLISSKMIFISLFYYRKFSADESKIIGYSKKLEVLAMQDPLTKLQNRRGLTDYMVSVTNSVHDVNFTMNIAIGDIDFFKKVNDTYGHEAGDYVLCELANVLTKQVDNKGKIARWGGEEFLILYENMNGDDAFVSLDMLRYAVKKHSFEYKGQKIPITMTFGLEEYNPKASLEKMIEKADEKLYIGKQQGRDRVIY